MLNHYKMNFVLVLLHFDCDERMRVEEIFVEIYYLLMEMLSVDEQFVLEIENVQHVYEIYLDLDEFLITMFPIKKEFVVFYFKHEVHFSL
jgi:hypothetical protein